MKRLIPCIAISCAGVAHAQSVNWPAGWASCSAEASAHDALSQAEGLGAKLTSKIVQANFERGINALPTVTWLQGNLQKARSALAHPNEWTYLIQFGSKLGIAGPAQRSDRWMAT
jgi:hypothetical protein